MRTKPTILITGGLGRLGVKTALHLAQAGHPLTLLDVMVPDEKAVLFSNYQAVRIVQGNASDWGFVEPLLHDHDTVVHFACTTVPQISELDPAGDIQTNLVGTLSLFQASQRAGVQHFIFPSSGGTVYGEAQIIPTPEDAPLQPISYHGAMKLATEQYLRVAEAHGKTRCTILRISNPYGIGTGDKPQGVIDTYISRLQAGKTIQIWGDGTVVRDYVHIDDVVRALALVVVAVPNSSTYNIGTGVGSSINEILSELSQYFDLNSETERAASRTYDVSRNILDISRARRELGWEPTIGLAEGIRRVLQV
jgi:UDP-glucose 4-epimerase